MKLYDQHVHSNFSGDSKVAIEDYCKKAKQLGLSHIIFTDHCDYMPSWCKNDELVDYPKYVSEIFHYAHQYNLIPLIGIEMGYQRKKIPEIKKYLSQFFDLIILSVHEKDYEDYYYKEAYEKYGVDTLIKKYLDNILDALDSGINFDVLGHIDYIYRSYYKWYEKFVDFELYRDKFELIIKKAIDLDVAIEINTSSYDTINSFYYIDNIIEIFKKYNGKYLTVSSDAHVLERYYSNIDLILMHLKANGINYVTYFINRKKHLYEI